MKFLNGCPADVEKEASKNIEENERECFKDAIVSSRSLNKGFREPPSIKAALPQFAACVMATSFHVAVGIAMAYSAVLVPQLEKNQEDLPTTKTETSWMASIVVLSVPIGALIGGFFTEAIGSLKTIQLAAIPSTIGWIMIALATNVPMILVGRVLTGSASAMGTAPAMVYITEVAGPEFRGSLLAAGPGLASFGMVLSYIKGAYLDWRVIAWISIIYAAIPLVLLIFLPESPMWLIAKGRPDAAKKSLEWIYRFAPKVGKVTAAEDMYNTILKEHEIRLSEQRRSKHEGTSAKLRSFLKPTGWKPMFILILLFLFQQYSGIYITLFYAVTWFEEAEVNVDPYKASIWVGLTRLVCSIGNTYLLRRFKRRMLCITSSVGMAIFMLISGYYTYSMKIQKVNLGDWIPVACLLFYVATSMIGMLTIPWTMTAELFPTDIRGLANSIIYSIGNVLMFAAVQSYRGLTDLFGGSHGVQWFFSAVSLGTAVFVYIMLPETHGKKLSDIEEYFENNFVAIGSQSKVKKRNVHKITKQDANAAVSEPLNPKSKEMV
ncbi:facilitated trehalose transporter Tret1-like isoform X1 [Neodiprion virginianus]|uniref:facilitated trehalose transporter Tret1-like isoform X1 n=1 Tax=Neodiprion virginianus TaxID=2961670 RepID=UPI001EE71E4D|nr:facilitated trehalose transporter Tret1-like isoform X1 [Neodiprion virginianus]